MDRSRIRSKRIESDRNEVGGETGVDWSTYGSRLSPFKTELHGIHVNIFLLSAIICQRVLLSLLKKLSFQQAVGERASHFGL